MPRPKKGPRLGGSPQHERHMLANLATQLFIHESITTTEARARHLRPYVEKLITKGKRGDLHARRTVMRKVTTKYAVYRLFDELAPQFEGRDGGYTRIVKTTPRKGDNAPMAVISLVLEPVARKEVVADAVETARRAAARAATEAAEDSGAGAKDKDAGSGAKNADTPAADSGDREPAPDTGLETEAEADSEPTGDDEADGVADSEGSLEEAEESSEDDAATTAGTSATGSAKS